MGSSAPKATKPKDIATAATSSGIGTAVANTWLGNMNESNPYGASSVFQSGTQSYTDPYTGRTYEIPTFTRQTTLNDAQKGIFNANQSATANTASAANLASKNLGSMFSKSIDLSGAPAPEVPTLQTSYETDFSADRQKVEDALMARLNPQLDRDRQARETDLSNRGIAIGSDAYTRAMSDFGQNTNDARIAAILNAGQEQSRLAGLSRDAATFGNTAKTGQYGLAAGERARQMDEQTGLRNQQLSETQQLMASGQASMPSFTGSGNMGQIGQTDVAGLISNYDQQRLNAYNQKQSNIGGMLGGLAGLFSLSDARAKDDIEKIGQTNDGLGLYSYRYKGSPQTQVGLMAQDVKKKKPKAVMTGADGLMRVDYKKALS
jgi:hypothetical protein